MWKALIKKAVIWRVGLIVIGLLVFARLGGKLQFIELMMLDYFLRIRPPEETDEKIVIVGIDEADIQSVGTYPIPDHEIAKLLNKLQKFEPAVIGLDIVRDLPVEPGYEELITTFDENSNIIVIEKALGTQVKPPKDVRREQISFNDFPLDDDGHVRRSFLVWRNSEQLSGEIKYSLSLRLAAVYLSKTEGSQIRNGIRDRFAVSFGLTELPRVRPNSGSYVRKNISGVQVLLNYRAGRPPFRTLSMKQVESEAFDPSWVRNRIVIVGLTAPSVQQFVNTSAITNVQQPGRIDGVEFQAHATSQIISAVLEKRPLLQTWFEGWEYLWIVGWGLVGIGLGKFTQSPLRNLLAVGLTDIGLVIICYGLFLAWGWWVPVVPALLVLAINGVAYTAFYQNERALRTLVDERQQVIERTFNVIHNGPLQTLAQMLRELRDDNLPEGKIRPSLEKLNDEIRALIEILQGDIQKGETVCLGSGKSLHLNSPIHELFYEIYSSTLERNFKGFETVKVKIRQFDPLNDRCLSVEQKRGLCHFLEECLCNIGKHAIGTTRISAIGTETDGWYTLCLTDNGPGCGSTTYTGQGTKQILELKARLKGRFKRESIEPRGTRCELSFPIRQPIKNKMIKMLRTRRKSFKIVLLIIGIISLFRVLTFGALAEYTPPPNTDNSGEEETGSSSR